MSEYEVSVRAYQHVTVEADSEEEAERKAKKKARLRSQPKEVYQLVKLSE